MKTIVSVTYIVTDFFVKRIKISFEDIPHGGYRLPPKIFSYLVFWTLRLHSFGGKR